MIEYGSLTCSHCATFATTVFPAFQKAYVDTGKVHFIFREFSRNPLDLAAFVLARCEGDDKALATIDLLFAEQDKWAFVDNPLEALITALRPTGMSHDQAMACLKDQSKADAITKILNAADAGREGAGHADLRHRRQGLRRRAVAGRSRRDLEAAGEVEGVQPPRFAGRAPSAWRGAVRAPKRGSKRRRAPHLSPPKRGCGAGCGALRDAVVAEHRSADCRFAARARLAVEVDGIGHDRAIDRTRLAGNVLRAQGVWSCASRRAISARHR